RRRSVPSPTTRSPRFARSTSPPAASGATLATATLRVLLPEFLPRRRAINRPAPRFAHHATAAHPSPGESSMRPLPLLFVLLCAVLGAVAASAADLPTATPEEVGLSS